MRQSIDHKRSTKGLLGMIMWQFLLCSCSWIWDGRPATLLIESSFDGQFDLFKVTDENPLELVAEQGAILNQEINLEPGVYWLLADCSSKKIVVRSGDKIKLKTFVSHFESPLQRPVYAPVLFKTQCSRAIGEYSFNQSFENKYHFVSLQSKLSILVGMRKFEVDFAEEKTNSKSIPLASMRVQGKMIKKEGRYYVWPKGAQVSAIQSQIVEGWLELMPGEYSVEINGSHNNIVMSQKEILEVGTSVIRVVGEPANEKKSIRYYTPAGAIYDFDVAYELLPGNFAFSFSGSKYPYHVDLKVDQTHTIRPNSVVLKGLCSPWELQCYRNGKVYLFKEDQHYSFHEGLLDEVQYYLEPLAKVSIAGTQDIKKTLAQGGAQSFGYGVVMLKPNLSYATNVRTELVQIQANTPGIIGRSLDLDLRRQMRLNLLEGSYLLNVYNYNRATGGRTKSSNSFWVRRGEPINLTFQSYVNEKAYLDALHEKSLVDQRRAQAMQIYGGVARTQ